MAGAKQTPPLIHRPAPMKIPTDKASVAYDANLSPRTVARTRLACTECRTRKYKCDGKSPTCSSCEMRGTECAYPAPEDRKRVPYKTMLQEMAKQIATLEAKAEEDKFKLDQQEARILLLESRLASGDSIVGLPLASAYGTSSASRLTCTIPGLCSCGGLGRRAFRNSTR
ncbi:hypothetical protein EXIGLDRAFT_480550 [Exidia glandulosa HHB12029]|uniref:Zn(2)-C6 fungal-type domain-containing protein n=1 Tax=Exidia glandulosa HHB12029 TaxID=1314781 RepID=A0A166NGP6_EXIGL|nr:hypothetical protein EXIGLDRAFT_480550 [Exidia glandulosa HHB12029]